MKTSFYVLLICFTLGGMIFAQAPGRDQAIALFQKGEIDRALPLLEKESGKNAADAELRNYIGLAYLKKAEPKKAYKHFQKATEIEPANTDYRSNLAYAYHLNKENGKARKEIDRVLAADRRNAPAYFISGKIYLADRKTDLAAAEADRALDIEPLNPQAHTLKADSIFQAYIDSVRQTMDFRKEVKSLQRADDILKNCLEKCVKNPDQAAQEWRRELIGAFLEAAERKIIDPEEPMETPDPGTTRVKILTKPRASYTDKARQLGISGNVTLLLLFARNGSIPFIIVLKKLGGGLDEEAIKAAAQIKFEPKMRNGEPVSSVLLIQYGFTIY
jgi:tetratricopeptide (TPR) repeat protein